MANQFAGKAASEIPALRPDWGKPTVPPSGILGEAMETSASFEARSAPLPYPTVGHTYRGPVTEACSYAFFESRVIRPEQWAKPVLLNSHLEGGHYSE